MKLLVFGYGFSGSALARRLIPQGWDVAATARGNTARHAADGVTAIPVDDRPALVEALKTTQAILVTAPCAEEPELLAGAPIGMYHCPDCGAMVVAGFPHPPLCLLCASGGHPSFDRPD